MAGRPSKSRKLAVWMNGERVGEWLHTPRGGRFAYTPEWLRSPYARPLSLSLPLAAETLSGPQVDDYFDNLLPDSIPIRKRVAERFGAWSSDAFPLLEKIGRDCAGAVQLLPPTSSPTEVTRIDATPLTEAGIERLLDQMIGGNAPGAEDDHLRISIAGAQEKTALLWHEGQWCVPHGSTPTTHILKLPLGEVGGMRADFSTSVENEWFCAQLVRAFGLPVADCEIGRFGRHKVLIVTRFDRRLIDGKWWARLPQEDFCQATGTPATRKYEEHGGPGMSRILDILRGSDAAQTDRRNFLIAQLLFWLLAAPDGHAKNFSIFLEPGGRFRLTPLYDIMSAWPVIGNGPRQLQWQKIKLAMAVRSKNTHYRIASIQRRHWSAVAKNNAVGESFEPEIQAIIGRADAAIEAVTQALPVDFPGEVSEKIVAGIRQQLRRLAV